MFRAFWEKITMYFVTRQENYRRGTQYGYRKGLKVQKRRNVRELNRMKKAKAEYVDAHDMLVRALEYFENLAHQWELNERSKRMLAKEISTRSTLLNKRDADTEKLLRLLRAKKNQLTKNDIVMSATKIANNAQLT